MNVRAMYPYTYGDEGGEFKLSKKQCKCLIATLVVLLPIAAMPSLTYAVDTDVILRRIEQALKELEGTATTTRAISPVGGLACVISGVCISQAKLSVSKGDIPATVAFACGAAIALCGDRIAASKGF